MTASQKLTGSCHCGNITATVSLSKPPSDISLRACQCTFCRSHGAVSLADPKGEVAFRFGAHGVQRYKFGLGITDFLICPNCGAYAAAMMTDADEHLAVLNPAALGLTEFADHEALPMDYDGEDTSSRLERRKGKWMPARIEA